MVSHIGCLSSSDQNCFEGVPMKFVSGFLLSTVLISIAGCGGSGSEQLPVFPVSGKVTMAGAAVAKATVVFSPLDKNQRVATAVTDNDGMYKLTTYDSFDGATAGKFEVMISKVAAPTGSSQPMHDPTGANTQNSAPVHNAKGTKDGSDGATIDPKWGKPGNGMTAEVKSSGENVFDFKLD